MSTLSSRCGRTRLARWASNFSSRRREGRILGWLRLKQDVLAREFAPGILVNVTARLHAELVAELFCRRWPKHALDLRLGPDIESAFAFFLRLGRIDHAVGILGRVKASLRIEHVAQYVIEDLARRIRERAVARNLERFEIRDSNLGLVV